LGVSRPPLTILNEAGTRASVLGVLVLPDGAAPPLALVELPAGEAPPLAPVDVMLVVVSDVDVDELDGPALGGPVGLLAELLVALAVLLECGEPPHPAMTRKAARRAENAARRLTFPA
jgi:hypothetical protein